MTAAVIALSIVCVATWGVVVWLILSQREERKQIHADAREERSSLLDRIQHPEVRQVPNGEVIDWDAPKDSAEMAFIGREVPEFVSVGSPED